MEKSEIRTPAEPIYKEIGKRITSIRKMQNLTQKELAGMVSSTRQSITLYETGIRRIPIVTLVDIANVLEVNICKLLPDEIYKNFNSSFEANSELEHFLDLEKNDQKKVLVYIQELIDSKK